MLIALIAFLQAVGGLFMPYSPNLKMGILITAVACPVLLLVGLVQWLSGVKVARFFTLAWFVYLIGQFAITLSKFGLIPRTTLVEYGPEIGASLEVILLSFALADRMNDERRKRHAAQDTALMHEKAARQAKEQALSIQSQANEELEERVDMRTRELQETLGELSVANEKLQSLSMIDGLTQVQNRRAFDDIFDQEWRRCGREQVELSLLLLDADHFKLVNDRFGHQAGDECLKFLGRVMSSSVRRPGDSVARYGGEEFVIVMPNTSQNGAAIIADIIEATMTPLGYQIEHVYLPYARRLKSYRQGLVDVASDINPNTIESEHLIGFFSDFAYAYENFAYSLKKRNYQFKSMMDLIDYRLMSWQGAIAHLGDEYAEMARNHPLYSEHHDQSLQVKLLYLERVDVIQMDKEIFSYYRAEVGQQGEIDTSADVDRFGFFGDRPNGFLFRSNKMRNEFNRQLRTLKESGDYEKILARYQYQALAKSMPETSTE